MNSLRFAPKLSTSESISVSFLNISMASFMPFSCFFMMFSSSQGNVEVNGFIDVLYVSNAFSPTSTQNDEHNH